MRTLLITVVVSYALTACGYRTPLALPKPDAKPPAPASVPAQAPAASDAK
jgi:predicted small lipoprotein YifL